MSGDHLGRGHGDGLELDRIRPYEPGDDVRQIDWNATARTLVPQVREDVPDRQLTAWLLLDHSPSMHFGTADRRKADVAEGAALVVGRFAARRGNRLGVVTFGAGRETVSPPAGGSRGMLGLLRAIATEPPEEGGGETSPARALALVGAIRTTPGVVVIVSDFRGPRDWLPALTEVAGRHAVIALEITDPREDALVDVGELTLDRPRDRADAPRRHRRSPAAHRVRRGRHRRPRRARGRRSAGSASATSDSPPTVRGCPPRAAASPGPPTEQDDPHELPRARRSSSASS